MKDAFGIHIPQTLDDMCTSERMALVIYDMQVGITRQVKDADVIVGKVQQVLAAARAALIRTFFTRHMSLPKPLMGAFQYRMAMAWQRVDDPDRGDAVVSARLAGFAIVPELHPAPSEAIFDKITMSAFEGTPLDIALRDCGIRAVAIVGIAMEIGIEPTARHARRSRLHPGDHCRRLRRRAPKRRRSASLDSLTFAGDRVDHEHRRVLPVVHAA